MEIEMIMSWVTLASGIYLAGYAFIMNTDNLLSGIIMRAIPGIIGIGLMINGAKSLGLI
jgi:hypothetical protein